MSFPSLIAIKQAHIKPRKKLGQNFLIDGNIADKIVAAGTLHSNDTVIEIGSGLGALTQKIAAQVKQVYAVEIDKQLADYLQSTIQPALPVTIINDSILAISFQDFKTFKSNVVLIGNIPYAITTPLFMKILEETVSFKQAVLMVQREVYERLRAMPCQDKYGLLTVFIQAYLNIKYLFRVPAACFYPRPKVDSAVLLVEPRSDRLWNNPQEELFRQLVTAAFAYRRKTLINCLKTVLSDFGIAEHELKHHADQYGIDLVRRGESFSLVEFDKITTLLLQLKSNGK